jgi:hypothetical protein
MFWGRNNAGMLNGDFAEGFKTVDQSKGFSIFLEYAEPTQVIRGVGRFIYACV